MSSFTLFNVVTMLCPDGIQTGRRIGFYLKLRRMRVVHGLNALTLLIEKGRIEIG